MIPLFVNDGLDRLDFAPRFMAINPSIYLCMIS